MELYLIDVDPGAVYLAEPEPPIADEILSSPMMRHPQLREEVERWVEYWQSVGSTWFQGYLERMSQFSPLVDSALTNRGLPPSLRYLPIVESGYSPRAVSRAGAVGLWQFMAPTARGFGMDVGPLLDERRNPYLSTAAAMEFLADLRFRFGSWFLALAAYNAGPNRVDRILRRHAHPLTPRSDSLYWEIRSRLPRETRDFVPKFLGALIVASNPRGHGLGSPDPPTGFAFDRVTVPDATTLDIVAKAAGVSQAEIERLNPEIVRGITPPGQATELRVPPGTGPVFAEGYARIPPEARVTFVEHRVSKGETLSGIALRYGVRLSDLEAANPRVQPQRLQIGQRITVPVAPTSR
ncbi:MAG: transglycosylase SLT domain-containing protein [Gemmatimonadota bacterium]|jgi:membrane-bound lytic murein transglycosylase D